MPRNRVIYQSEALYVGPTPATGSHTGTPASVTNDVKLLQRIQSCNYSFNIDRTDVNQYGELAAIDRIILTSPTVSLDFNYLQANLVNEKSLGFTVSNGTNVSCISGILNKSADEKNYFVKVVGEGVDAVGTNSSAANQSTIGLGNGFITSYAAEGSVGNFPTVSLNIEALNMKFDSGVSGLNIPAINPSNGAPITLYKFHLPDATTNAGADTLSVLRPGDVTLTIKKAGTANDPNNIGTQISDAKIQSYNFSFDLARTPLEKLGSKFAFSREIDFPVTITASIDANIGDLTTGNLADFIVSDETYDINVAIKHPTSAVTQVNYLLKSAKLDSQEFSSSIGDNKSVSLSFSTQIGSPNQTDVGLFMSGVSA
jgi:hypothetical protein